MPEEVPLKGRGGLENEIDRGDDKTVNHVHCHLRVESVFTSTVQSCFPF